MGICVAVWQVPTVPIFICRSGFCGLVNIIDGATSTEVEDARDAMCDALRASLALQFNLTISSITITNCALTPAARRLAFESGPAIHLDRSLQSTRRYRLCVREASGTRVLDTKDLLLPFFLLTGHVLTMWLSRLSI